MAPGDQGNPGISEILRALDEFVDGAITIPVTIHEQDRAPDPFQRFFADIITIIHRI